MNQVDIFYPVILLVGLTFFIAFNVLRSRIIAVKNRQVSIKFFQLNQGKVPDYMQRLSDNYDNLLAMPVLFYLAMIVVYVVHLVDGWFLSLAWLYVATRFAHSYIHTVYNNVLHRMLVFVFSSLILMIIWLTIFYHLFNSVELS